MDTVDNSFNPFVDEAQIPAPAIPATKVDAGTPPGGNGKIVK